MSDVFSIVHLERYAKSIRKNACLSLYGEVTDNLDDYMNMNEVISIIQENSMGKDEDGNLLITEDAFNQTFDTIRTWIEGYALAKLAAKDKIECAWDADSNEMIFWNKQNGQTNSATDQ